MTDEVTLGRPLASGAKAARDAIHVAVVPVVADEELAPGAHVSLVPGTTDRIASADESIGIVDPFLPHPARVGQTVWMLLYPGTITSLRHDWTHPDFDSPGLEGEVR